MDEALGVPDEGAVKVLANGLVLGGLVVVDDEGRCQCRSGCCCTSRKCPAVALAAPREAAISAVMACAWEIIISSARKEMMNECSISCK